MESIRDYEMAAKDKLTQSAYDYYRSGANGMVSLADNERAYHRLYLKTSA
jgi:isopentenyl diphosphate isomerase/L-lactate dehydrogenase-like FMN-dependent dehydrogenase